MFRFAKTMFATTAVVATLFAAGFQSAGAAEPAATTQPTPQAMTCSKCQVTWVKIPMDYGKGRVVTFTNKKSMECDDCKAAVENFFTTGEFKHTCKTCGDSLEICDSH